MNSDEQEKCKSMSAAFKQAGLSPIVKCIMKDGPDECISAMKNTEVDAFTTDGGHMFSNLNSIKPIMAENYGFGKLYGFLLRQTSRLSIIVFFTLLRFHSFMFFF